MEIIEIADKRKEYIAKTDESMTNLTKAIFEVTGMSDLWQQGLKAFVAKNYRAHRENYESLYQLLWNNQSLTVDQIDPKSIATILQFYPEMKDFYKKISAKFPAESFEKTIKDACTLRTSMEGYVDKYHQGTNDLFFMQMNAVMTLQKLAVMGIEHFKDPEYWKDLLNWTVREMNEYITKVE